MCLCLCVCEKLMPGFGSLMWFGDDDSDTSTTPRRQMVAAHFSSCRSRPNILHTSVRHITVTTRRRRRRRHITRENCNNITLCYDYDICVRVRMHRWRLTSYTSRQLIFFHFDNLRPYLDPRIQKHIKRRAYFSFIFKNNPHVFI